MTSLTLSFAMALAAIGQTPANDAAPREPAAVEEHSAPAAGTPESYLPPPEDREPVERKLRGFHEYSNELLKWFKQEATAASQAEQAEAIIALCAMYHELRTDPRYPTSDALEQMKTKIWSRLTKVKRELEIEQQRQARSESSAGDSAAAGTAEQLAALSEASSAGAFGGQARQGDFGPDLVELIERTIAPTKWDVNGGPFTIVYYAPLHALVVRASSDVHGRVGGLLNGLRQAGN